MRPKLEVSQTQKPVSGALLNWWAIHQRSYPWRAEKDPYRILIAEVMLHRTRADQVAKIYNHFVLRYPTIADLARAKPVDLLRILKPLGLRWRARLVSEMGRMIHERYHDQVPQSAESLKSLPGVSDYIAAAVQCFAFAMPTAILDTNTVRVTGRIFGLPISDSSRRKDEFRTRYVLLQDPTRARDFNLAMIDLAALLCRPLNPRCQICPISEDCEFGRSQMAR